MSERERATLSGFHFRSVHVSLCRLPVSPLNHLNVKTEAFIDRIPLSSDTRAQPEHLRRDVHHAILLTGRETVPYFWFLFHKSSFYEWISSKNRPVCNNVRKISCALKKSTKCSVSIAKQRRYSHSESLHCETWINGWIDECAPHLSAGCSGLCAAHCEHLGAFFISTVVSGPNTAQRACNAQHKIFMPVTHE